MKIIGTVHKQIVRNNFIPNCTKIFTLFILIDTLTLADTIYYPESEMLNKLMKIHSAKSLRQDLFNHIRYVENIIKHLDEWAFIEIKEMTDNEELTEEKLIWLANEISKTRDKIKELTGDLAENTYNITYIRDRYENLQTITIRITNQLNENTINSLRLLKEYLGDEFPNLEAAHQNLLYLMTVLLKQIETSEKILLTKECIQALRSNQHEDAIFKLDQINDDNVINDIIREVYDQDEKHFNLILKFGDKIRNTTKSFLVYRVLIYEMEVSRQNNDSLKIIEVIKSINNEVIYQLKTEENIKSQARLLVGYLMKKLKMFSKESLKITILNGSYYNENVPIFDQIFKIDEKYFSEICIEVLIDFFEDDSVRPLYGWIMEAFTDIFDRIFNNNSDDKTVFKLAYFINNLLELASEQSSSTESNGQSFANILEKNMKFFIKRLPESVRNIVFIKNVCILNLELNEYLYATNDIIGNNKFKVFSNNAIQNFTNSEQLWLMKRIYGNVYNVQNIGQNFANLYTSDIDDSDEFKTEGHIVYTWLPVVETSKQLGIWQIEPDGKYCFIKNVLHREYLYVSEETSHVAFTGNISLENNNNFKWHIVECSQEN
ncbi:uncharacterized protein [Rhodnius prolixus]|uniref:uncharacterized protein n=1 Tax=Rhodnius prolixus TaxID=13249 RepID=UPI003D188447